jgi:hypothetical protein
MKKIEAPIIAIDAQIGTIPIKTKLIGGFKAVSEDKNVYRPHLSLAV